MYVVEALRNGNRENHSYVVGVYQTLEEAAKASVAEEYWRSGKYECYITVHETNKIDTEKMLYVTDKCFGNSYNLEDEINFIIKRSKAEFINE